MTRKRAPEADGDRRFAHGQPAPVAVEAIEEAVVGISLERVDVEQVRVIGREAPADIGSGAGEKKRRARYQSAGEVPAFARIDARFVPGERAGERSLRIEQQTGRPVGGARGRDRDGERAGRGGLSRRDFNLASGKQPSQLLVQAVEERQPQHEERDDVLAPDRSGAGQHIAPVLGGVEIEPGGIAVEQRAGLFGEVDVVALIDRVPDAQEVHEVVALGRFDAVDIGELPARREYGALQRREVVLRMGKGEAEGHVGVALPGDMGHPVAVADNLGIVFGGRGDRGFGVEPGQPCLMRRKEAEKRRSHERDERDDGEEAAQDHEPDAREVDLN